jgi:hypothetical protein
MLLVLEIFRSNLIHSETNCSSLLISDAVISFAIVADVYSVESSAYIDTLALLKASHLLLVKIENSKGPKQPPWGIPDFIMLERLPLKNPLCVLLDR